MTRCNSKR